MSLKTSLISIAVALVVGFAGGLLLTKKTTATKQTQQTSATQNDIVTVTKVHKTKAGDTTTVITTTDKSTKTQEKESVASVPSPKGKDYHVNALIGYNFNKVKPSYGLSIDKQFIGPIRLGVFGNTDQVVGVTVGFEF